MVIHQGDIYWASLGEGGITHPYVIIQEDVINHSRVESVVACVLSSNIRQANAPGNVLLGAGEANLPRQSVVVVSKVSVIDKSQVGEYIGTLDRSRIDQILAGMRFLQLSTGRRGEG